MIDHFAPWHTLPFTVIDFETTGQDPETCHPVQVAAVTFSGGDVVHSWSSLIDPGVPIPEEASAIHGITDAMVKDAPDPGEAISILHVECLIGVDVLCAYNAPFDSKVLKHNTYLELPEGDTWIDPLVMIRHFDKWVPGKGRHKLEATCKRWGVELDNAHNALSDAIATGMLLWAMRSKLGDLTYSELIRRQRIHAAKQEREFQEWLAKQPPLETDAPDAAESGTPQQGQSTAPAP